MDIFSMIRGRKRREKRPGAVQEDTVGVSLPMLTITLNRKIKMDVPHEVTIIVPRAEIRFGQKESELIYSSITVVHAPRHPLAGEQPPGGGQSDTPDGGETDTPDREPPDIPGNQTTPRIFFAHHRPGEYNNNRNITGNMQKKEPIS